MGQSEDALKMLEALAAVASTIQLYPDPLDKPPFERALVTLGELAQEPVAVEVFPEGFAVGGDPIVSSHVGVEKLARKLFLHNVGSFGLIRAPEREELIRLFEELELEASSEGVGDFQTRLDMAHVKAFKARDRSTLIDRVEKEDGKGKAWEGRHPDVREVLELAEEPERLAEALVQESLKDPAEFAGFFVSKYEATLAKIESDDWTGRELAVQAFVEAFFFLPRDLRIATLEKCVELKSQPGFENFLDQFASRELAELAPHLNEASLTLLLEYARVSEDERRHSAPDFSRMLDTEANIAQAKSAVQARVGERLAEMRQQLSHAGDAFSNLAFEVEQVDLGLTNGVEVMSGLLQVEDRPFRLRRLMRVWAGRVTAAIQDGRLEDALQWVEGAVKDMAELAPEGLEDAFSLIATSEVIDVLTRGATENPDSAESKLLANLGRHATDPLVEALAEEQDAGRRRKLIDALAELARIDPTPLSAHMSDQRWYVVRNLATVLGKSGRPSAGSSLVSLLRHADERVRVEALRNLVPVMGNGSLDHILAAVADRDERVRSTALSLIGAVRTDATHWKVLKLIHDHTLDTDTRVELVGVLAADPASGAKASLTEVANLKTRFGSKDKAIKEAAKRALKGGRHARR